MWYWWEDLKAWQRGEKRVAPKGVMGRVYERKSEGTPSMTVSSKWKAKIKGRVYRAKENKWYNI